MKEKVESVKGIKAQDILLKMDEAAEEYLFPMPDNACQYNAGMRLTAFRSSSEWLIIFEMLNYTKNHEFVNEICAFGNKLSEQGFAFESQMIIEEDPDNPFRNSRGEFVLNPSCFKVLIKGENITFAPTPEAFKAAKVGEKSKSPMPAKILRLIAYQYKEKLFLEEAELLQICDKNESGLYLFLRLDAWHHPNLADDELPSSSLSLQQLAKALEVNNPEIYECPSSFINSDWFYWTDEHWGWE